MNRFGSMKQARELAGLPVLSMSETLIEVFQRRRAIKGLARQSASSHEIVDGLKRLLAEHGYLSGRLINADPRIPSQYAVGRRFGSLFQAYALAGWPIDAARALRERDERWARKRATERPFIG
jgi:hypothetical protein